MEKTEINIVFDRLKSHYQNVNTDSYVLKEWYRIMQPYDVNDILRKIDEHLKSENAVYIPKPHYLVKYLKTIEEKEKQKNTDALYEVQCNLCGKYMTLSKYDTHYDKCLDIEYILDKAKQRGETFTREDLEEYGSDTTNKLFYRYLPDEDKKIWNL